MTESNLRNVYTKVRERGAEPNPLVQFLTEEDFQRTLEEIKDDEQRVAMRQGAFGAANI